MRDEEPKNAKPRPQPLPVTILDNKKPREGQLCIPELWGTLPRKTKTPSYQNSTICVINGN